jgi:hypothetical protein
MADKYSTIKQHQPLRTPSGWNKEEKTLIVQLEEIFDDIYRRFGRLKFSDLGDDMQKRLQDDEGNIAEAGVDIGRIFAVVQNADGTMSGLEINSDGIEMTGNKRIHMQSGGSEVLIKAATSAEDPAQISMTTDGVVKLYGDSRSKIIFSDVQNGLVFSAEAERGVQGKQATFTHATIASLDVDNLNVINSNVKVPNIYYGLDRPAIGNQTIWLEPQVIGAGGDFSDTKTVPAAGGNTCSTSLDGTTYVFKYRVSFNKPIDLTDVSSITLAGTLHKDGADQSKPFTLSAKIKCSGSDINVGEIASGSSFTTYAFSETITHDGSAKTATGVEYTIRNSTDSYGRYSSFDAGSLAYSGTHASELSDVCTVHYIP